MDAQGEFAQSEFDLLVSSRPDEEVAATLGYDVAIVISMRAALIEAERRRLARPVEDTFADYRLRIEAILRKQDRVVEMALQPRGARGPALKTAADTLAQQAKILDQVIARGQELGVLPKAATNKNVRVTGGVIVGAMTNTQLFDEIARLKREGDRVMDDYERIPFALIADPDPYSADVVDAEEVALAPVRTVVRQKK